MIINDGNIQSLMRSPPDGVTSARTIRATSGDLSSDASSGFLRAATAMRDGPMAMRARAERKAIGHFL